MYVRMYMYVCMYVNVCLCVCVCMYVCIYADERHLAQVRRGSGEGMEKRDRTGSPYGGGLGAAINAGMNAGKCPAAGWGRRKRGRGGGSL